MGKLNLGNSFLPPNWSNPAPSFGSIGGLVWFGLKAATDADLAELDAAIKRKAGPNAKYKVDEASLVGRYHPDWSSHYYSKLDPEDRPGGLGSHTYEMQKIREGVEFAKGPIFHFNATGNLVKSKPKGNAGAYHKVPDPNDPVYVTNYAGPRPGSPAARQIGTTKRFYWDTANKWYSVRDK